MRGPSASTEGLGEGEIGGFERYGCVDVGLGGDCWSAALTFDGGAIAIRIPMLVFGLEIMVVRMHVERGGLTLA